MANQKQTDEEIFLAKIEKMEKLKRETDEKLIVLGKSFFEDYNTLDYKTIQKRMADNYKQNPFERRKYLTEEQEKVLFNKFESEDLTKIINEIKEINLNSSPEMEPQDKKNLNVINKFMEGFEVETVEEVIQKIRDEVKDELKNENLIDTEYKIDEDIEYLKDVAVKLRTTGYYPYKDLFEEIKKRF